MKLKLICLNWTLFMLGLGRISTRSDDLGMGYIAYKLLHSFHVVFTHLGNVCTNQSVPIEIESSSLFLLRYCVHLNCTHACLTFY